MASPSEAQEMKPKGILFSFETYINSKQVIGWLWELSRDLIPPKVTSY